MNYRSLLLCLLIIFLPIFGLCGERDRIEPPDLIIDELRKRVAEIGSFQAEYSIVSLGERRADITVIYDKKNHYTATKLIPKIPDARSVTTIVELSDVDQGNWEIEWSFVEGESGKSGKFSLTRLVERQFGTDQPIGVLLLILNEIFSPGTDLDLLNDEIKIDFLGQPILVIELGFRGEGFPVGVGVGWSEESLSPKVSWLDDETMRLLTGPFESEEYIEFSTDKNERRLRIDRRTGLLLEYTRSHPDSLGRGGVVLEEFTIFGDEFIPSEMLPSFDSVFFDEVGMEEVFWEIAGDIVSITLEAYGREIEEQKGRFEKILGREPEKIANAIRFAAREQTKNHGSEFLRDLNLEEIAEEVIIPRYNEYRQDMEDDETFSFNAFRALMGERTMSGTVPFEIPELTTRANQIESDVEEIISEFSGKFQRVWETVFDFGISHYTEGWKEGAFILIMENLGNETP